MTPCEWESNVIKNKEINRKRKKKMSLDSVDDIIAFINKLCMNLNFLNNLIVNAMDNNVHNAVHVTYTHTHKQGVKY